jgi:hypothetical protein
LEKQLQHEIVLREQYEKDPKTIEQDGRKSEPNAALVTAEKEISRLNGKIEKLRLEINHRI